MAACNTLQAYTLPCDDGTGGVDIAYIADVNDLNTFTADTSGNVTAMTMDSGKQFFAINLFKQTGIFNEQHSNTDDGNSSYAQTFVMMWKKLSANDRYLLRTYSKARVMLIIKDNLGNYILMGKTGAKLTGVNAITGKMYADLNGNDAITFSSTEPEPHYYVSSSLIAALTAPA